MGKQIKKKSSKKGSKKGKRIIKKNNASSDTSDMRELLNTNSSERNMMGAPMQQQMNPMQQQMMQQQMNPMQQAMEIDPLHANSFVPMNNMQNGNNMNSNLLSPAQMAQNIGSLANLSKLNLNQSGMQDYQFSEMSQMSMAPPMNQFNGMPPQMNQFNGMPPQMNQFNGMTPSMDSHMNQFNGMPPQMNQFNGMTPSMPSTNSINFNNLAKLHSIKQL